MNGETGKETPLACDFTALNDRQRARYRLLRETIGGSVQDIEQLDHGLRIGFAPTDELITRLAEFVSLERLCCPFLRLTIDVEPRPGSVRLSLTGPSGTRELLSMELGNGL